MFLQKDSSDPSHAGGFSSSSYLLENQVAYLFLKTTQIIRKRIVLQLEAVFAQKTEAVAQTFGAVLGTKLALEFGVQVVLVLANVALSEGVFELVEAAGQQGILDLGGLDLLCNQIDFEG